MRDALAALRDLAGLSLKDPFEDVTAWRNSWYCADDTFLLDPSSISSSDRDLSRMFSAVSGAAVKFTSDPSLGEDSDEEDLLTRDLDHVELLDPSISLHLLTGVWGLRISDSRRLNCRSVLVVWNWHHSVHVTLHQCHHWHLVEKTDLIDPSRQRRENNTNILRQHHWNLSLLIQHLRLSCSRPCWGTLTCWAGPPAESAPAESSRSAGSASPAESSSSAESASPAKSSTTAGSSSPAESSSSACLA